MRIVICSKRGRVDAVFSDEGAVEFALADFDVEAFDEGELIEVPPRDCEEGGLAYVRSEEAIEDASFVEEVFARHGSHVMGDENG